MHDFRDFVFSNLKLDSSDNRKPAGPVANLAKHFGLEQDQGDGAVSDARLHRNDQLVDVEHQLLVTHHAHGAGQAVHITALERETFEEGQSGGLFQGDWSRPRPWAGQSV